MATYSQRYDGTNDTSTAGAFVFHADATGNDIPISKVVFGANNADPTAVTASVGLPVVLLAGTAGIGKLTANTGVTIGAVEIAAAQTLANVTTVGTITNVVQVSQSGTWSVRTQDGSGNALTSAVRGSERALSVQLVDASGNQIVTFAGTEYTEGDVDTSVTGTAIMWEDAGHVMRSVSSLKPLPISDAGGNLSIDDGGGVISVDDGGGALTVDGTVAATQSGTWNVGTVTSITNAVSTNAAQSGAWSVRIQDGSGNALTSALRGSERALSVQMVDTSGNQIVSFGGGGTQYAEDVPHNSGDTGTMALAVRNDTDASLCGTDLDYTPLQVDANGYLKVNIKAGAGSGGTASTDDAAFTAAAGSGTPMMGFVTADSVDSGDVGVVGMLANRQLKVTLYDSGGAEVAVGGGTQYTEGATDATITGTALMWEDAADTLVAASAAKPLPIGDAGGTLTVDAPVGTPVFVRLSDGASAITTLPVSLASVPSHAVTNAGTFAVQESGTPTVVGSIAHDSADAGNPVKVGAKATTSLSGVTLVANADRTDTYAGVDGVQITRPHCNLEDIVTGNASNTDGTSTQCIAAQAAGVKTYLTTIILTNTSSSNIYVEIKDGTTAKLTIPVPANGGAVCNLPVPLGGTTATAWNFDPSAATTTVYCSMVGFKSKV